MKSLRKGLACLRLLADGNGRLALSEICGTLRIPKSTAYRIVRTLLDEGVLRADSEAGVYSAGTELYRLAGVAFSTLEIRKIALPVMEWLAERTKHSVFLLVRSGFAAICVAKVTRDDGLDLPVQLGSRRQLHCSGIAKAFLPYIPPSELAEYLSQPLDRFTPATMTTAAKIRQAIQAIVKRGYAVSTEEFMPGARSLGVAILDARGDAVAALGIGGSIQRLSNPGLPRIVASMRDAAAEISRQLGYDHATSARVQEAIGG